MEAKTEYPDLDYEGLEGLVADVKHVLVEYRPLLLIVPCPGHVQIFFREFDRRVCQARLKTYIRPVHPKEKDLGSDCQYVLVTEVVPGVRDRTKIELTFPS